MPASLERIHSDARALWRGLQEIPRFTQALGNTEELTRLRAGLTKLEGELHILRHVGRLEYQLASRSPGIPVVTIAQGISARSDRRRRYAPHPRSPSASGQRKGEYREGSPEPRVPFSGTVPAWIPNSRIPSRSPEPMSLKGRLASAANTVLRPAGIAIVKKELDFDCRLTSAVHVRRLHEALAESFQSWVANQSLFDYRNAFNIEAEVASFYEEYLRLPFRDQRDGSRFNNALWLDLIAKAMQPSVIIDSGTYAGASAWALSRGAPNARVFSFDIDLSRIRFRASNVRYIESDWTSEEVSRRDTFDGLCYFDDHVDQARRLIEAHDRGYRYAIFDDDFPLTSFSQGHMARCGSVLPKVEFVLDRTLSDGELIEWSEDGAECHWRVDEGYMRRARQTISETERLPNTSLITGIHQTPYRMVRFVED